MLCRQCQFNCKISNSLFDIQHLDLLQRCEWWSQSDSIACVILRVDESNRRCKYWTMLSLTSGNNIPSNGRVSPILCLNCILHDYNAGVSSLMSRLKQARLHKIHRQQGSHGLQIPPPVLWGYVKHTSYSFHYICRDITCKHDVMNIQHAHCGPVGPDCKK